MRRAFVPATLAWVLLLAGCGMFEMQYETATLEDVMKGSVPSPVDRYRIARPVMPALRGNTGIIREGALFVVIVGPDLKKVVKKYESEDVEFGVHLVREPRRYLILERVFLGKEEVDLFADGEKHRFRMPELVTSEEIPMDKFETVPKLCEVPPEDTKALAGVEAQRIYLSEFLVDKVALPEILKDAVPEKDPAKLEKPRYFLTSDGSDYLVINDDSLTYLILDFLRSEDREFKGGVKVQKIFEKKLRTDSRVAGTIKIRWVSLGGPMYFRAA